MSNSGKNTRLGQAMSIVVLAALMVIPVNVGIQYMHAIGTNQPPTADAGPEEIYIDAGESVTFDASDSKDSDGKIEKYKWDFLYDGTRSNAITVTRHFPIRGVYEVTLTVWDDLDDSSTDSVIVHVNELPIALIGHIVDGQTLVTDEILVDVGEPIHFDGSPSSDFEGPINSYEWIFCDGDIQRGSNPHAVHSFSEEGIRHVILIVTDNRGSRSSDSVRVVVHNDPPLPDAGADIVTYEDTPVTFDGTGTWDTTLDIDTLVYNWDFGDGNTGTGPTPTHTYMVSGKYYVELMVTDNENSSQDNEITVLVKNDPPIAEAGSDLKANEDEIVIFIGTGTDTLSDEQTLNYYWDFGDGSSASGASPSHIYTEKGVYTARLTVTDDDGDFDTDTLTVTINNIAPTADADLDQTASEDELVFFHGSGGDTSSDEPTLIFEWDFGDGLFGEGRNPTHTYQNLGTYLVTLTVTDNDGDFAQDTTVVTVTNIPPTVDAGPDFVVNEDQEITFNGMAFDTPSDIQSMSFVWNFGDGTTGTGPNPSHVYPDSGSYPVTLDVYDDDSIFGTDSLIVTIENVVPKADPIIMTSPFPIILENDMISFSGSGVDTPSDQQILSFSWDFGDGSTSIGANVNHAYAEPGIYTVTLTVTDDDSDSDSTSIQLFAHRHSFEAEISDKVDIIVSETATYIITIKNTGTLDDIYSIELTTSIDPSWLSFPVRRVFVQAGGIEQVFLKITPPSDFPLDYATTLDFELRVTCGHDASELSNAPLVIYLSNSVTIIETYESRLRWAIQEIDSLIVDRSGGNWIDATLLKALEEVSEALLFASTVESPDFDYVMSFEHVKEGIHNLEMVSGSVTTDYIIDLLLVGINDEVFYTIWIAEVQARADNHHVIDAWAIFADAQSEIAAGDYENGIERYKSAYMEAERADGEWVPREYTIALNQAVTDIDTLLLGSYSTGAKNQLEKAKDELYKALDKSDHGLLQDSFNNIKNAIIHLQNAESLGAPTSTIVEALMYAIEISVMMLILETETHVGVEVNDIKQAWSKFKQGQQFSDNGLYLQAIDKFDRAYNHALLAEDWIPIADAGPDQIVNEDDLVHFDASNSRDRDGIVLFYEWDFQDGTTDTGVFVSHSFVVEGTYEIILKVTDNECLIDLDFIVITVGNVEPETDAGEDIIAHEDELLLFKADYSDTPSDLPGLTFSWDFGDGNFGSGVYATHSYINEGTYTVELTVSDADGSFTTDTLLVTIINPCPKADGDLYKVVYEDELIFFEGFGFDTPSDMPYLSFHWDFADGTTGAGALVTHTYTNEGFYAVILTVTDDNGDIGTYTVYVNVLNVPPIADAGWIQIVNEDKVVSFSGTGLDTVSDQTSLTYHWDFGDGSTEIGPNPTHTYTISGVYTVTLTIMDDNGDIDHDQITIIVENVQPTASAGSDLSSFEDMMVTFSGTGSDTVSDYSTLTYSWNFGDGSSGSGTNPTHVFSKSGEYIVTLTVTDDDGGIGKDSLLVNVKNNAPTADTGTDGSLIVGEDQFVIFSGKGGDDPTDTALLKYAWGFADPFESTSKEGRSAWHRYSNDGTYTATLTVEDDDLETATDTVLLTVNNVAPTAYAGPDLFIFAGIVPIQFRGVGFDTPSDEPYLNYHWYFDDGTSSTERNSIHYFTRDGTYNVTLTVEDDDNDIGVDIAMVTVYIDTDGDGLPDWWEIKYGLDWRDPIGVNGAEGDPDGDELWNIYEFWANTHPKKQDTDEDSYFSTWEMKDYQNFWDGTEVWYWMDRGYTLKEAGARANNLDTDGDRLPDGWEVHWGPDMKSWSPLDPDDNTGHANGTGDPDDDLMENYHEFLYDTNPLDDDTDKDGLMDGTEDKNHNGYYDGGVGYHLGYETHAHRPDTDFDGLLDGQEDVNKNGINESNEPDPTNRDTDGDGILDGNHNTLLILQLKNIQNNYGNIKKVYLRINDTGMLPFNSWKVPNKNYWSLRAGANSFSPYENISVAFYFNNLKIDVCEVKGSTIGSFYITETGQHLYIEKTVGNYKFHLDCRREEYAFSDPWPLLSDADRDGIDDLSEAIYYSGRCADFRINNSDGDNQHRVLFDKTKIYNNLVDSDSDNDGIPDGVEIRARHETDPLFADSDNDGLDDFFEVTNLLYIHPYDPDGDGYHNAIDFDSDGDGLLDGPEKEYWESRDDNVSWDTDSNHDGFINILDDDSDDDDLSDGDELVTFTINVKMSGSTTSRTVDSDPAFADTDSDGYDDKEERSNGEDGFITDPTDPDTDDDGSLDSEEKYTLDFETETRYKINEWHDQKFGKTEVQVSGVIAHAPESRIYRVEARVGIDFTPCTSLKITLDNGARSIILRDGMGGKNVFHDDYNLLDKGFPLSDFTMERTWTLIVEDTEEGGEGSLESYGIHIFVRTNPNNDDCDDDQLKDHEEITLGTYGWLTEPYVWDTDGDTLSDGDEVYGLTKGVPTNPRSPDSDADSFDDKIDNYPLYNMGVKVTLHYMVISSDLDDDHPPVEPQALVTMEGKTFSTPIGKGTYYHMGFHYTVDVPDDTDQTDIKIEAWEDDGEYKDDKLDILPGPGKAYSLTYDCYNLGHSFTKWTRGDDDDKEDATIYFTVETVEIKRVNTIFLNSTDVGIYFPENGEIKYTGEQRFYICYIDVTSSPSAPFVSGLNTIIVPRKTYVDSLLNQSITSKTLPSDFEDLQVSSYDDEQDTNLGSVAGTVSGELTGSQAMKFLEYLLYQDVSKTLRNAYYHVITNEYATVGISNEVLEVIPFIIKNSATGEIPNSDDPPSWWDNIVNAIAGTLEAIKNFVINGWVAFTNFLAQIGEIIGDIGQAILDFFSDPAGAIKAALEAIVDLLNAIINWIKDRINDMINGLIKPIVDSIYNLMNSYTQRIGNVLTKATDEYNDNSGEISASTLNELDMAFTGPLFWVIMGIMVVLTIILTFLTPFTFTFGFLIGFAITAITMLIMTQLFSDDTTSAPGVSGITSGMSLTDVVRFAANFINSKTGGGGGSPSPPLSPPRSTRSGDPVINALLSIFGVLFGTWGLILSGAAIAAINDPSNKVTSLVGIVCGIIALIFSFAAIAAIGTSYESGLGVTSVVFGVISLFIGVVSSAKAFFHVDTSTKILIALGLLFGGIAILTSIAVLC